MTLNIPLQSVPNQAVGVSLGGQSCQVSVYQKFWGLFVDLYVDDSLVIGGVICLDRHLVVISTYLDFVGDLMWRDTLGTDDPDYKGVGSRFQLQYLSPDEVDALDLLFPIGVS